MCLSQALEIQKRLKKTKVYHAFSYFPWKETTHKPLNMAAAKTFVSNVYVIGPNCFNECLLFYVITGRHYHSWKFNVTLRLFLSAMVLLSLKQVFEKGLVFYVLSPQ